MTLVETLIAGAVLALILWLASGLYSDMLDRARTRQAFDLVRALENAVAAYHEAASEYPPGRPDKSLDPALVAMTRLPSSSTVLSGINAKLLQMRDGRPVCRDPWGRSLRYLTATASDPDTANRISRNQGRPIFESAGPDGRFGDISNPVAATDDIRSDEPGLAIDHG